MSVPSCAFVKDDAPPAYTESCVDQENKDLKEKIRFMEEQENIRLRNSDELFKNASNAIHKACEETIHRIVEEKLATIAEPILTMTRHKSDDIPLQISASKLFPVYDGPNKYKVLTLEHLDHSGKMKPVADHLNIIKRLGKSLLPTEMVCVFTQVGHSDNVMIYQLLTTLGRQTEGLIHVHYSSPSYNHPIALVGDPIPLTNEYIDIAMKMSHAISTPHTVRLTKYDELMKIYRSHYSSVEMLKELEDNRSKVEIREDRLREEEKKLEGDKLALQKERIELENGREQLKKRLKVVVVREKDVELKQDVLQSKKLLLDLSSKLLDSCDTVDNDLIGNMVQEIINSLNVL